MREAQAHATAPAQLGSLAAVGSANIFKKVACHFVPQNIANSSSKFAQATRLKMNSPFWAQVRAPPLGYPNTQPPTQGSGRKVLSVRAEVESRNENSVILTIGAPSVINAGEKPQGLLMLAVWLCNLGGRVLQRPATQVALKFCSDKKTFKECYVTPRSKSSICLLLHFSYNIAEREGLRLIFGWWLILATYCPNPFSRSYSEKLDFARHRGDPRSKFKFS